MVRKEININNPLTEEQKVMLLALETFRMNRMRIARRSRKRSYLSSAEFRSANVRSIAKSQ